MNHRTAFRIVIAYVAVGVLWILLSDRLLETLAPTPSAQALAQTLKGWFFIFVTGGMLYLLIDQGIRRQNASAVVLKEREQRLKSIIDSSSVGIAMLNMRGEFIDVNPRYSEMLGYDRETLLGRTYAQVTHPDDMALSDEKVEALARGDINAYRIEKRFLHSNGETVWADMSVTAHRDSDGRIEFILGMAVDISKRKAAEVALEESRTLFDSFMYHLPATAFMKDAQGRYLFVNEAYRSVYGFNPEDRIGKTDEDLWPPEVARKLVENDQKVWSTGKALHTIESLEMGSGSKVVRVSKFPLMHQGRPHVLGGIAFDITDQVRTEEEKERLESQLLQARKMEAIGTLAGGIAHDFNNLLMGILGNASLMRMDLNAEHPHNRKLENIEQYVQSGSDLTRRLLGFAQIGKYEVRTTDITDLIRQSSTLFGRTKKEIHVHTDLPQETWAVDVDQGQIEEVLINLYVNAGQAMPAGGNLYLQTENLVIDDRESQLLTIKAGRYVRITVADTGVGMDEGVRQRVFDPFFTTREMGRGTGMGLASAYGIVQNHQGTIGVSSQKGEGARFYIYLPASEQPSEKSASADACPRKKGSGTVFLVDDEQMILDVGQAMLERLGYTVRTFGSGRELIEALATDAKGVDLVILDMIMPDMGGGEVYEQIRSMAAPVRVLLSSGYSMDGQAEDILGRGCNGFIQKPFNMETLSMKICEILES